MNNINLKLLSGALAAALAAGAAQAAAPTPGSAAVIRAQALLTTTAGKTQSFANAGDAFTASDIPAGAGGVEHVRFTRTYRGMPVIGGDIVVHSRAGKLLSVSKTLRTTVRPTLVTPRISSNDAIVEAGVAFGKAFSGSPNAKLVVSALEGSPKLAYQVQMGGLMRDGRPTDMRYLIDAQTGKRLSAWDTVHTATPGGGMLGCQNGVPATGNGQSPYMGVVPLSTTRCSDTHYQLLDKTRGNGHTFDMSGTQGLFSGTLATDSDNIWGKEPTAHRQKDLVAAHFGVSATWDYFKTAHGHVGIAGDGRGATTRVHFGRGYANAFWNDACFCMTFGDGMTALDVSAHEMAHGITSRSAGLIYADESGGLNEATSDIFSAAVEFHANLPGNPPDYLVGEELPDYAEKGALRFMFKPSLDNAKYKDIFGDDFTVSSFDCYGPEVKYADPHYSSGVGNHFFYLLAEGAKVPNGYGAGTKSNLTPKDLVCNGNTSLTGIGIKDAASIWYLALTAYLTSDSTYPDTRAATLSAATDLYGPKSRQYDAVTAAWDAVSVPVPTN